MRIEDKDGDLSRDCDNNDVSTDEPIDSHRNNSNFQSNFSIGGPYSAFSGIVSPGPVTSHVHHEQFYKSHLLPGATLYGGRHALSTEMPIAPAFAQIFQRRRRRENRPRRQRTTFTSEQTLKLELEYNRADYITRPRRFELAEMLSLTESQIKIWFQNRRAKDKRIEKAHMDHQFRTMGYPGLPGTVPLPISYPNMCGTCAVPPISLPVPVPSILYNSTTSKTLSII